MIAPVIGNRGRLALSPCTKIGHLDGLGDLPPQARAEYHTEMSKALQDDQGRDLLARYLNILTPGSVTAPGYWENASNPATLTQVGATRVKGAGQQPTIDSASRAVMELYSNALGLLLKQDGVGFHRPYYNPQVTRANGMEFQFAKALSRDDIINIGKLLDAEFGGSAALIPVGDKQVRILNFGDAKDQRVFHKTVEKVMRSDSINNAADLRLFGSDGDLVFNNWKEKPNGEDYVSRISSAGRPDVLEYLSDFLAPRVQAVDRKFAGQYNLKTNEGLEKYLSDLGKNLERKAQGGVVRFAKGGSFYLLISGILILSSQKGRPIMRLILAALFTVLLVAPADAQSSSRSSRSSYGYGTGSNLNSHSRSGYVRRDTGTYVAPHRATNPNRTRLDNYSTRPNYNPYKGKTGTRSR